MSFLNHRDSTFGSEPKGQRRLCFMILCDTLQLRSAMSSESESLLSSQTVYPSKSWPLLGVFTLLAVLGFYGHSGTISSSSRFLGLSSDCMSLEPVECGLSAADQKSLVFISSSALGDPRAKATFEEMAAKLPEKGERKLRVLLLEDPGLLKKAFWDKSSPNFAKGMNFEKMNLSFGAEDVQTWTDGFQHLDGGWTYDNRGEDGLGVLGLKAEDFMTVSIFSLCANKMQAKALFELQSKKVPPGLVLKVEDANPCLTKFKKMLDESNVIFANGGNPDLFGFVVMKFAPEVGKLIQKRVREGTLLYIGRSAGGMVGGSDFALTAEPNPVLTTTLLDQDTKGLALAGKCALRPHTKNLLWDLVSKMYADATGQTVILAANGEGLFCDQGCCGMTGATEKTPPEAIKQAGSMNRIAMSFKAAYADYTPQHFFHKPQSSEVNCSDVSGKVVLTSSALSAISFKALQALLRSPSAVKVVSLDDGAYLSKGFWDAADVHFAKPHAVNYVTLQTSTDPVLVQKATNNFKGLGPGVGSMADESLLDLGISPSSITHISAFDRCATEAQKKALFEAESAGVTPKLPLHADEACISELMTQLAWADLVVMGNGNVDFLSFTYKKFAPSLGEALVRHVNSGKVFLGMGAGSTFAGASTMAASSTSKMLATLLEGDMAGLGLVGNCAVRPHFNSDLKWNMVLALLRDATTIDFLGLRDGSALVCAGHCNLTNSITNSMAVADSADFHRGRVHMILDKVLK